MVCLGFEPRTARSKAQTNLLSYGGPQFFYSVTRFGDLLDFGKLFNAFVSNYFAQISHILRQLL